MTDTVHVGANGAGYWGTKLVREYVSAERKGGVKLTKICDSSRSALLSCKERVPVKDELLTDRIEDIIEDSKISAVHIATANHAHYSLARMALEAGKDVLVEKRSFRRARFIARCRNSGITACVQRQDLL